MGVNDPSLLALSFAAGTVLGAGFFGGLWWTVNRGIASKHPALWFLVSVLLRMSVALLGFYFVGRDNWQRLVLCLVGFVIARSILMRLTGSPGTRAWSAAQEADHAS